MSTETEIRQHSSTVDEMRTLAANKPRTSVLGKEFIIYPEVFHPDASFGTTEFMNREFLKVVEEDLKKKVEQESFDFLEVGCGAGYTAILAALASQKCHVWATDISEEAVKNTIENAKLHEVDSRVEVVTADVFNHKIFTGKKFDMIYWNIPWVGQQTEPGTDLELLMRSILDPGYQSFRQYLLEAHYYLKKTGRLFVAFSFNLGSKELFDRVVNETGWSYKITSRNNFLIELADGQQEIDVSIVEFLHKEE